MAPSRDIEDLVRQSLSQRAQDVEPTPALWREVDRRVTRRRRLQVAVWSLAGATALVAAAVLAPGLLDRSPTPEVEPLPPGPQEGIDEPVEEPTPDDPADADDLVEGTDDPGVSDTDTGTGAAPVQTEPLLVASERSIDLIDEGGRAGVLEMDAEGESWIMGLAVRPGSTADDYTAAVLTTAEGFWDLRHLHVVDGEVVTWEVFPQVQHRPSLSAEAIMGASVSGPAFSPDGDALAWVEGPPDDLTLRIVGWGDAGPGTGDRATDNTSFTLEPQGSAAGQSLVVHEWIGPYSDEGEGVEGVQRGAITATLAEPSAGAFYVPLERQADGAWTMQSVGAPPGGIAPDRGPSEDGATYALGGMLENGEPRWMVRLENDGVVLHRDPFGDEVGRATTTTSLPEGLMAAEGFPTLWVREVGDAALVGSANTEIAYLVDTDGNVGRVQGDVAWAAPIR